MHQTKQTNLRSHLVIRRLTQSGFDHVLLPLACFVVFALIGSFYLYHSLAATSTQWKGVLELSRLNSGYCLTTTGSTKASLVELDPCSKTYDSKQVWDIVDIRQATVSTETDVQEFYIQSADGGECIDDWGASKVSSYPEKLYPCSTTDSALTWLWGAKFTSRGYSAHQLSNLATASLCLDDRNDATTSGTYVGLYTCKTSAQANQEWIEQGAPGSNSGSGGSGTGTGGTGTGTEALAACTTSGSTGGGSPSYAVSVGAPVSGDSSTEINNAITTASKHGGGAVILDAGTYTISHTITLAPNVVLSGVSEGDTILLASGSSNVDPMITTNGNSNITLQNLTVNQNGASSASSQSLASYMVEDRNGSNVIFQNVATREPSTYSIVAVGATKFCFRNNNVEQYAGENGKYNQLDGIHILNSSNGDVRNNYVDNSFDGATDGDDGLVAHAIGGTTSNVTYEGNVVRGGQNGAGMGVWIASGGKISNITVTRNEFWGEAGIHPGDANELTNSSFTDNILHNNSDGFQLAGKGLNVSGNYLCSSGSVSITGTSNTVSNNDSYTGCKDAASTSTPPAAYPPIK